MLPAPEYNSHETLAQFRERWSKDGVVNFAAETAGVIRLSDVRVPAERREHGIGTRFMQELAAYADRTAQRIALSPSTDFGASSTARLKRFYKRFGFVENKGRRKDFSISETMIREPRSATNTESLPSARLPSLQRAGSRSA